MKSAYHPRAFVLLFFFAGHQIVRRRAYMLEKTLSVSANAHHGAYLKMRHIFAASARALVNGNGLLDVLVSFHDGCYAGGQCGRAPESIFFVVGILSRSCFFSMMGLNAGMSYDFY